MELGLLLALEQQELEYDSGRSRTLRRLIEAAAEPVAAFPHPRSQKPNRQPVLVYRWHPERFDRQVSCRSPKPRMREDRHARTNPGVHRQCGRSL